MKILGIIPARGGSKGIKNKNIVKLVNKPLIKYTIDSALESKKLTKIFVSTDSPIIKNLSLTYGLDVPILRPKKLSGDNVPTIKVIHHVLNYLEKIKSFVPDIVTVLQPTSPLRNYKLIDQSITQLQKSKASSIIGVSKIKHHPFLSFSYEKNFLKPFKKNYEKYYQRQKFPPLFYPTGSIFTCWTKTIKKYNSLYGPKPKPLFINSIEVDVDDLFDLFTCEMLLKHWKKYNLKFKN